MKNVYIYAQEVENEKGEVNKNKIKEIMRTLRQDDFYAIDKDGNHYYFESHKEAKKAFERPFLNIRGCLEGSAETSNGFAFVRANVFENIQDNFSIKLNKDIIIELQKKIQKEAVFIVNHKGEFERVDSRHKANVEHKGLYYSPSLNMYRPLNNFYYISAGEVEHIDENGKRIFDKNKLMEIFEKYRKSAIYVVDKDKNCSRYNSFNYAAFSNEGVTYDKSKKKFEVQEGYKVLKALDVEVKDKEEGLYKLDKTKLLELAA